MDTNHIFFSDGIFYHAEVKFQVPTVFFFLQAYTVPGSGHIKEFTSIVPWILGVPIKSHITFMWNILPCYDALEICTLG